MVNNAKIYSKALKTLFYMLLVVGGIKGGSGKSTIAVNLAVARSRRHSVLLLMATISNRRASGMPSAKVDIPIFRQIWTSCRSQGDQPAIDCWL